MNSNYLIVTRVLGVHEYFYSIGGQNVVGELKPQSIYKWLLIVKYLTDAKAPKSVSQTISAEKFKS